MYIPAHFSIQDPKALARIIQAHPLGILVTSTTAGLDANHIPFEFHPEQGLLTAHVARANPVWQQCALSGETGAEVLVIFRGVDGYISPNWYPSKHETHRQVPTWNYEVVHVQGRLRVRDDEKFVRGVVARLTRQHEATEPKPWRMSDAPPEYTEAMLKAVVGIEIAVTKMEGKAKLGQNREPRDRLNAAQVLMERGHEGLGKAMRDVQ